eukprot:TRINITY_DN8742_c0_g1_i3.p1 TRINITY_DN8742_c0_g1~~TRINITY_DN8742_c0_g1_i3.p1  ORF type:complete len:480 (-),score=16.93 TRINITY_DN8742_c0_g1_i3:58-1476(-)
MMSMDESGPYDMPKMMEQESALSIDRDIMPSFDDISAGESISLQMDDAPEMGEEAFEEAKAAPSLFLPPATAAPIMPAAPMPSMAAPMMPMPGMSAPMMPMPSRAPMAPMASSSSSMAMPSIQSSRSSSLSATVNKPVPPPLATRAGPSGRGAAPASHSFAKKAKPVASSSYADSGDMDFFATSQSLPMSASYSSFADSAPPPPPSGFNSYGGAPPPPPPSEEGFFGGLPYGGDSYASYPAPPPPGGAPPRPTAATTGSSFAFGGIPASAISLGDSKSGAAAGPGGRASIGGFAKQKMMAEPTRRELSSRTGSSKEVQSRDRMVSERERSSGRQSEELRKQNEERRKVDEERRKVEDERKRAAEQVAKINAMQGADGSFELTAALATAVGTTLAACLDKINYLGLESFGATLLALAKKLLATALAIAFLQKRGSALPKATAWLASIEAKHSEISGLDLGIGSWLSFAGELLA